MFFMRPTTGGQFGRRDGGRKSVVRAELRQVLRTIFLYMTEAGIGNAPLLCKLRPPCVLENDSASAVVDLRIAIKTSGCFDQAEPLLNIAVASIDASTGRISKKLMNLGIHLESGEICGGRILDKHHGFHMEYDADGEHGVIQIKDSSNNTVWEEEVEAAKASPNYNKIEGNLLHFLQEFAAKLAPSKPQSRTP